MKTVVLEKAGRNAVVVSS